MDITYYGVGVLKEGGFSLADLEQSVLVSSYDYCNQSSHTQSAKEEIPLLFKTCINNISHDCFLFFFK